MDISFWQIFKFVGWEGAWEETIRLRQVEAERRLRGILSRNDLDLFEFL